MRSAWVAGIALGGCLLSVPVSGQVVVKSRAAELTVTGRVQAQFNTTSVSGEPFSENLIRRARMTLEVEINDFVSGKVQPDFGEGKTTLKDAWVRLTFSPGFRITTGQFKRPFDLFELTSSTRILVIERAGTIRGVNDCAGPGGVCTFSRLTEKLQLADRDIGIMFDGTAGKTTWQVAMTNGTGANKDDENGTKSWTGRVRVKATSSFSVAVNLAVHDYANEITADDEYAVAGGADIEIGNFSRGFHAQGGVVLGQNWRNLDLQGDPSTFVTTQGIATFRQPVANSPYVTAVEPVARISFGDPDTDLGRNGGVLLTPGFIVHLVGRNRLATNVDVWIPDTGSTEWSLKFQSNLHF